MAPTKTPPHVSAAQVRAARAYLDLAQDELAQAAGVSRKTIMSFEGEGKVQRQKTDTEKRSKRRANKPYVPRPAILLAIRSAFEQMGIAFVFEGGKPAGILDRRRR
jgi:DNA-binding XRE family transcriptional regulator